MTLYIYNMLYYSIFYKIEKKKLLVSNLYELIEFKNIKRMNSNIYLGPKFKDPRPMWRRVYKKNILQIEKFNNYKGYELDYYALNKNIFLNLESKINSTFYKKKEAIINKKIKNIIGERLMNISSRKISNNLTKPHYYFTTRYYEKNLPSQIKHWRSSIYNFLKNEAADNIYKDIYTSKLLKLFFSISGLRIKNIWSFDMIKGLNLIVKSSIFSEISNMIKYASDRTELSVRKLSSLPTKILTMKWVISQWRLLNKYNALYETNKEEFSSANNAKIIESIKDPKKGFLISRPLFKHTSFNLIIDLFVYNNKRYTFNQLKNLSLRRSLYKYMYSMYIDCYAKIRDTINRPRFFYINLIEPSIHRYYDLIVKCYGELIIIKNKPMMLFLYLFLLQVNFVNKLKLTSFKNNFYSIFNKYFNYNTGDHIENIRINNNINSLLLDNNQEFIYNHTIVFKRRHVDNNYSKLNGYKYLLKRENKELFPLNKGNKNDFISDNTLHKQKKKININRKSNFIKYNKYFADLEKISNSSVDLNTLSLWNSKDLGKTFRTPLDIRDKSLKDDTYNNTSSFLVTSYNNRKKNFYYNNKNKGLKKNVDIWNKKRNKLTPKGDSNLFNNNLNRVNNNNKSLLLDNNIIINNNKDQLNINIISNKNNEKNMKYYNNKDSFNEVGLDIEQYFNNMDKEVKKGTLLKNAFISFYFNNKSLKLNKWNKNISFINVESINDINQDNNKKNIFQLLKDKKNKNRSTNGYSYELRIMDNKGIPLSIRGSDTNSKKLWDSLDHSIIGALSKHIYINKDLIYKSNIFQINSLLNEIKKFKGFGNIWYLLYFINVIKKEFDIVKKDILILNNTDIRPELSNKKENISIFKNIFQSKVVNYKNKIYNIKLHIWPSLLPNNREESLKLKLGYNEKIFKPYYRYMIPFFILNSYSSFAYTSGYLNFLNIIGNYLTLKLNSFKQNTFLLINFFTVKILLDLLHYNYRSWIRVKNKYYYLSKIRFFEYKFNLLTINNWRTSHIFIKKYKKSPKNFWSKYIKGATHLIERIIQYAELDTKRKIFVPFVLYIEDVLFSIYGKWVIIRLWPLKKYYLSSFILANKIVKLVIARRKRQNSNFNLGKMSLKLIQNVKYLQIQKGYNFYLHNYSPWPRELLSKINSNMIAHSLNYNSLEFYNEKKDRKHNLKSYSLLYNNLSDFLPLLTYKYTSANKDFIQFMNKINRKNYKKSPKYYTNGEYFYYWLLPLRRYIMNLTRATDITGLKFKVTGRPSWKRNNNRKVNTIFDYGNRSTSLYYNTKLFKYIPVAVPRIRGYLKAQTQFGSSISKSKNGTVSVKIWISSLIAVDVLELLLHLVRIKDLYSQLLHRYFSKKSYIIKKKNKFIKVIQKNK